MKKTISLIIVLAIVILLTGTVNAADTLQSRINAGETIIVLDQDYTEDITIPSGKNVRIDLNGKKLTSATKDTITVELGATLTITGEGEIVNNKNGAAIFNNGTTTIQSGTIRKTNKEYYNIANHGTMTINGGLVINETAYVAGESHGSLVENGYYNYTSTDPLKGYVPGVNQANPKLTIYGGEFNGGLNTIKNDDGATLEIYNGTFKNNIQVAVLNWHIATINGGTFEVPLGKDKTTVCNGKYDENYAKGLLTVNGGTFNAEYFIEVNSSSSKKGNVKINDGTFNTSKGILNPVNLGEGSNIQTDLTISGGEFETEVEDKYKAEGMQVVEEDGKYLVGELHKITVKTEGEGTVKLSKTEAVAGQKITFTVTPAEGYKFKSAAIEFDNAGGVLSGKEFTMLDSDGVLTVEFEKIPVETNDTPVADTEKDETPKTGAFDMVLYVLGAIALVSVVGTVKAKTGKYSK